MSPPDMLTVVREELAKIAPDIDFETIDRSGNLHDEFDIDFIDHLNFITALHKRLSIDIPETDYPKLTSVDSAVAYLTAKAGT